jgi:CRP-like cAMP-binding protein
VEDFLPLVQYVERYIQLTGDEQLFLCSLLRLTPVRRKQCIVQPDFTCRYRSYVVKGAMRAYLVSNEGKEHTIALAIDDWWISDYTSYINQTPATLFVEALENSLLIQISYADEQRLMDVIPKFERFFRIITQRSFSFSQQRILCNLSKSAEERYEEFLAKYPDIANRVPQYALASYLGFSTEFLSRIRGNRAKKLI